MDEVKIHTGTRVKLKRLDEATMPQAFLEKLRQLIHKEELIQVVYLFALEAAGEPKQASLAVGLKSGILSRNDHEFRRIVDEIQLLLPPEVALKIYRLDAAPLIAQYCYDTLQPLYLRSAAWLEKQRRSLKS